MRLKIVSDGTAEGTKVIDDLTGEAVDGVESVEFKITAVDRIARVAIKLMDVPVELVGQDIKRYELTNECRDD